MSPASRRIYVPWKFEPEVWEQQGKYVKLDGQTYIVGDIKIAGAEPIPVELVPSLVPEGHDVMDIEHWMMR